MRSTNIECDCCWVNDAIVIDHSTFTRRLINCYIVVLWWISISRGTHKNSAHLGTRLGAVARFSFVHWMYESRQAHFMGQTPSSSTGCSRLLSIAFVAARRVASHSSIAQQTIRIWSWVRFQVWRGLPDTLEGIEITSSSSPSLLLLLSTRIAAATATRM